MSGFYRAPRVRWIHIDHAGLDKAAHPEAFRPGLTVTGSAGDRLPFWPNMRCFLPWH
jgi:hypothetical protein